MTKNEARFLHASTILVGVTGIVYGWMRYFVEPDPESFSVVGHPWQPEFQAAHILLAPLLLFACGIVWRTHVWSRVRSGFQARRPTGLVLVISLGPMVISGYAIQVTVEELWRDIWIGVHIVTSVLWILGYGIHQISKRAKREPQLDASGRS